MRDVAIMLDLDGTIVDPKQGIVGGVRHALARLGHHVPPVEELTWVIGPSLRSSFARLLGPNDPQLIETAVALYRAYYSAGGMYEAKVYAGMPEAIGMLRALFGSVYLCTAKPLVFAVPILRHFGLHDVFDGHYGADLAGTLDDKGDLIAQILAARGVEFGKSRDDRRP